MVSKENNTSVTLGNAFVCNEQYPEVWHSDCHGGGEYLNLDRSTINRSKARSKALLRDVNNKINLVFFCILNLVLYNVHVSYKKHWFTDRDDGVPLWFVLICLRNLSTKWCLKCSSHDLLRIFIFSFHI